MEHWLAHEFSLYFFYFVLLWVQEDSHIANKVNIRFSRNIVKYAPCISTLQERGKQCATLPPFKILAREFRGHDFKSISFSNNFPA